MRNYGDDWNFENDHRNRRGPSLCITTDDGCEIQLPTKWEVCSVCEGAGKHVNPSIDANGLSAEELYEDPDFAEDYFNGTYDVTCNRCAGRTTERVVDLDRLTPEQLKLYEEQCEADSEYEAMCRAERAMGA